MLGPLLVSDLVAQGGGPDWDTGWRHRYLKKFISFGPQSSEVVGPGSPVCRNSDLEFCWSSDILKWPVCFFKKYTYAHKPSVIQNVPGLTGDTLGQLIIKKHILD